MRLESPSLHRPAGPELLRVVRETFEAVLLPALTGEQRYTALMVGHALAICEREWHGAAVDTAGAGLSQAAGQQKSLRDAPPEAGMLEPAIWDELWQGVRERLLIDKGEDAGAAM